MTLFNERDRDYMGPRKYSESSFAFLDRSERPEAEKIRQRLEEWFARYPEAYKAELRTRFRSDGHDHVSSFFELLLHELLLRLECKVTVHPDMAGETTTHPDFACEAPDGGRFLVEARVVSGKSNEEQKDQVRRNDVYDKLEGVVSPDFYVGIAIRRSSRALLSSKRITAAVQGFVNSLDHAELSERLRQGRQDARPHFRYEDGEWMIDFDAIPKGPEMRGKPGVRPLGAIMEWSWDHSASSLRDAICKKGSHYGNLNQPYVVALAVDPSMSHTDVVEALFGTFETPLDLGSRSPIAEGVWRSPHRKKPTYKRISAVLVTTAMSPWNTQRARACLYHNPWTVPPYGSVLTCLPQAVPSGNDLELRKGESLSSLLGIAPDVPE